MGCRAPWYPASASPENGTVVVIDENPIKEFMVYQNLGADHYLEGDVALSLELLDEAVKAKGGKSRDYPGNGDVWAKYRAVSDETTSASPINVAVLCKALSENMPSDAVYIDETILHRPQILRCIERENPQSYLRPAGGLGQGLGTVSYTHLTLPTNREV